jgi:glycosyltransferase involved in cell wall biosynthesis
VQRILFITERFPPDVGGLASSASRISETLLQLGIEVDILTWSRYLQPGEVLPPASDTGIQNVYRVGLYRHWDMTMPHTLNVLDWLHQERQYNAVWGHYLFPAGFLATWFAALQGIPSTVSVRGNDIDRAMFPPGDFARLQWTLQNAKVVTAVSADMAGKIKLLIQRDDVLVLKNAVNEQIFSPSTSKKDMAVLRASLGIAENEVVLGFAGELREKKGQQFLLEALTTVKAKRPACLLIIGEVRASQEAVLQLYGVQHPEFAQRIIITGHLASPVEVAQHLQLCDVYLQPSLWEGMPNALLEALACGCCCIASDAGGIPEVIEHGKNGFIIGRSHLQRLGEAVLECLDLDLEVRREIGLAGCDRIQTEFSIEQEKLRLQEVLERLMPSSS